MIKLSWFKTSNNNSCIIGKPNDKVPYSRRYENTALKNQTLALLSRLAIYCYILFKRMHWYQVENCQFLFQWCDKDCILSKTTRTCHKSLLQRPQTPQSRQDKNWLKRFTVARERALSSISTIPQKRQMSYCLSSSMDWLQRHFSKIVTSLATLFS